MSATLAPFYELTPGNRGPVLVVVGYVFLFTLILLALVRTLTVVLLKRSWSWDDACVLGGTLLSPIQTVLTEHAVYSGLGRPIETLDAASIESYHKFTYASQLLAILVMLLAKLSVLILIRRLSPGSKLARQCYIIIIVVVAWAIFSVLGLGLQCGLPNPWVYSADRCVGKGALWYPVSGLNMLTDFVIALLFLPVILELQMPRHRQLTVCFVFGSRIIVCGVTIAQLATLPPALRAEDQTWESLRHAILLQMTTGLSMITAILPSLCRVFSELQTGNSTRLPEGHDTLDYSSGRKYELTNLSSRERNRFTTGQVATLTNTIFADAPQLADGDHGDDENRGSHAKIKKKNDQKFGARNDAVPDGVLQSWQITYEVEETDNIGSLHSTHSRAKLRP